MRIFLFWVFFLQFSVLIFSQSDPYSISFRVRTTMDGSGFPLLVGNKAWNSPVAKPIDLTSTSNFGITMSSGVKRGWSIFLQPNGAWGWNVGNKEQRLDFLPTDKQRINDGEWHEIQQLFDWKQEVVLLFLDGKEVARYNFGPLDLDPFYITEVPIKTSTQEGIEIKRLKQDQKRPKSSIPKKMPDTLKVVNWNIWHGGKNNGVPKGIEQTINILKHHNPDVICLQETYGSGPIIADSLDMYFFLISSNLSILSKFPFVEVFSPWDDFRFGGAVLQTGPSAYIGVFDVWLNYLPNTNKQIKEGYGYWEILENEIRLRGREALNMTKALKNLGLICPIVVGGDFNSGSHLDWTLENSSLYGGYFLPWPASRAMMREGFIDSYRSFYPNSREDLGYSWSPRFQEGLQYRIDYIYHDSNWQTVAAGVEGYDQGTDWPSDHALTWAWLIPSPKIKP